MLDQLTLSIIHVTLDESMLEIIMDATNTKQVWTLPKEFQGGREEGKSGIEGKEKGDHKKFNNGNVEFVENRL